MVKALININEQTNRMLNIIKAKNNLKDKSQAIDQMAKEYELLTSEPELKPEFIKKIQKLEKKKGKLYTIEQFKEKFGLKNVQD